MYNKIIHTVFIAIISLAASANASEVKELLKKVDGYRLPADSLQVETEIKLYKSGALDKERLYTVYLKPGRRSLIIFQSPSEKGQKVLMLAEDFWQIMPQSQRPIRITPTQKLLGDASAGDIATMNWSEDYDGTVVGEVMVDNISCLQLDITAQRKGVSYQRIELFVSKKGAEPVRANFYVASDKIAKQGRFVIEPVDGRPQITTMTLTDQIQIGRETVIRYISRKPRNISDEFYNPMFLIRNDFKE